MEFGQKKIFCESDLFDFTSFFWPGLFLNFCDQGELSKNPNPNMFEFGPTLIRKVDLIRNLQLVLQLLSMKTSLIFVSIFLASCSGIHLSKGSPGSLPMLQYHHNEHQDQLNRPLTMTAPSNHLMNYGELQGEYKQKILNPVEKLLR